MKKILIILLFLITSIGFAQEFKLGDPRPFDAKLGIDGTNDSTKLVSLNGDWQIISGSNASSVRVPFCTESTDRIKLSRVFHVPSRLANSQFRVVFLGIGQDASVALNGEFLALGRGSDALVIDVPPNQLRYDTDNTIEVELSPEITRPEDFPLAAGFFSPKRYSGIYRDVYLLALPLRRIESLNLKAEATPGGGRLQIGYLVRDAKPLPSYTLPAGFPANLQLRWSLTPYSSDEIIATNQVDIEVPTRSIKQGTIAYNIPNVQTWSPIQPNLYRISVRLYDQDQLLHEVTEFVGFQDIRITATGFATHSGIPIRIAAATYVEEFSATGWSATAYQLERDILSAKALGLNALRITGNAPHPYLLRLADRYGLWLLVDAPVTVPPRHILERDEFRQYIASVLLQFTQREGNHPSLLAVGTGYGFPVKGLEEEFGNLFTKIRRDCGHWVYLSTPAPVNERIADFQIWERLPSLNAETVAFPQCNGPLLAGIVGIILDPLPQKGSDPAAELRQSLSLVKSLNQESVRACAGFVLGGLVDYQTHYPLLNRTPDNAPFTLPVGVVTFQRNERTTFVTLRDYLNGITVKPAPVGIAQTSNATSFIIGGLIVLMLFAVSIGQNKVLRSHVIRSMLHPGGFFTDVREGRYFQFGETVVVGILISLIAAVLGAATTYGLRHNYTFDLFITTLLGSPVVKVWANRIIWNPPGSIAFFFIFFTVIGSLFAILLSLVSMFTRQRMGVAKALSYLTWGFANHMLLLPLTLLLVGPLSERSISGGWLFVSGVFIVWSLYRSAAAILIAFRNTARAATILLILMLGGIGFSLWYWLIKVKAIGLIWSSFRAAGW